MPLVELSSKIESQLEQYMDLKQSQPFANFIIQQLVSSCLHLIALASHSASSTLSSKNKATWPK